MNQRTFLGLTHNPFVPPKEGFFVGADRKTHLDHLRHLSQWSRRVLVVSGVFGIGKSTLFKELSANVEPQTMAARIAGTLVNSEREVLAGVIQGFGIAISKTASADDLADLICAHVQEQTGNGRNCLIMADDAHLFEPAALQRLVSLVGQADLRLVLFAEPSLVNSVDRAARRHELEWFEIRLTGFPKPEVREYLEWRFAQAQYRGRLPFTDAQLDMLFNKSAGNPGIIDSMAANLLVEMETGELHKQRRGFPAIHTALTLLLVVLVALVYLFVQPVTRLPSNGYEVVVATEPQPLSRGSEKLPPDEELSGHTTGSAAGSAPAGLADGPDAPDAPGGSAVPVPQQIAQQSDNQQQAQQLAQSAPQPQQTLRLDDNRGPAQATAAPEPQEAQEPQQNASSAQRTVATPVVVPEPAVADVSSDSPSASASASPSASPSTSPSTSPSASQGSSPVPVVEVSRGFHDGRWLLAQSADLFTMQLVTLSNRQRAVALINRQPDPSEFAIYELQRAGKQLYVITYGLFSSRAAARAAVAQLNGELQALKPWIRPMRLVQDAVRAAG